MAVEKTPPKGRGKSKPKTYEHDELESSATTSQADPLENWADKKDSEAYKAACELYPLITRAFDNKQEQIDACEEYWNIQNAQPDDNAQYTGNTQAYIPAVRDCINARSKRALKQLFPQNQRHVDALSSDGNHPYTQLSLLEHYIRKLNLQSIVRTDLVAGDVTGQWNLMVDWVKDERTVTKLVKRPPLVKVIDGEDISDLGLTDETDEEESTEEEDIVEEGPEIVPIATEDLVVLPPTCNHLQKAHAVAVKLRLSKQAVQEMVDQGVFILPADTDIKEFCTADQYRDRKNPAKKQVQDAGIKTEGTLKYALVYMVYTKLDLGGERKESAIIYFSGQKEIVGIIRNPLWSGKVPIISEPVEKVAGSFFGKSKIEPVKFLQWMLNDCFTMGQDSALYSLMPIWAVNPMTVPQWASLTAGLGAIWPGKPDDIKPMSQPQLWKEAAGFADLLKRQIMESMDVNEIMLGKMPQGRKNNQLMGAMQQEQMVNITDHATRYEQVVLNPLVEMLFEFDQQFRTEEVTVAAMGEIGVKAKLETIPLPQWGERYFFRWSGTEFMQGAQMLQQGIAFTNVIKGTPPQMLGGKTLDLSPLYEAGCERIFGPELAPRILVDQRNQYAIEPEVENEILHNQMHVMVHEADDDIKHLQSHMHAAGMNGDPVGMYKMHMDAHMQQLQKKREMAMAQQAPKGLSGSPGGGPGTVAPPGAAGTPKPGAMPPMVPRGPQQPPGAVRPDQMVDGSVMGRG